MVEQVRCRTKPTQSDIFFGSGTGLKLRMLDCRCRRLFPRRRCPALVKSPQNISISVSLSRTILAWRSGVPVALLRLSWRINVSSPWVHIAGIPENSLIKDDIYSRHRSAVSHFDRHPSSRRPWKRDSVPKPNLKTGKKIKFETDIHNPRFS
jgi:hypothetical protein